MKQNIQPICIACQESITNPVCQDCLEKGIEEWLKRRNPRLVSNLKKQTKDFKAITDFTNNLPCIFCKNNINACAYCYIQFIEEWFRNKHPRLVPEFKLFFNFS